jgi:hypothetical protein
MHTIHGGDVMREPKSIAEQIDCLARLTGAPHSFVDQVRALFLAKGIALDADAHPFLDALEEAFRREERIRCSNYRARRNLDQVHENFQKVGRAYVEQLSQLKRIHTKLAEHSRRVTKSERQPPTQVTIKGDHRTFVTRPVREELPLVPGPDDLQ